MGGCAIAECKDGQFQLFPLNFYPPGLAGHATFHKFLGQWFFKQRILLGIM